MHFETAEVEDVMPEGQLRIMDYFAPVMPRLKRP